MISKEAGNKLKGELDNNIQDVRVNQNQYSIAQNGKENHFQDLKNDNKYSNVNEDIICDEVRSIYSKKNKDSPQNKDNPKNKDNSKNKDNQKKKVELSNNCGLVCIILIGLLTVILTDQICRFVTIIIQVFIVFSLSVLAFWGMGGNKESNKTSYLLSGMSIVWLTLILNYFLSSHLANYKMVEFQYKPSFEEYKLTFLLFLLFLILFFIEYWNELYKEKNKEKMSKSIDEILDKYVKTKEDKKIAIDMLLDSSKDLSIGFKKELKNSIIIKFFHLTNVALIAFFTMMAFIFRNLIKPIEVESVNITSRISDLFSTVNAEVLKDVFFYIIVWCIIILYVFDVFFGLYKLSTRFLELYKEVLKDKKFTLLFGRKSNPKDLNE